MRDTAKPVRHRPLGVSALVIGSLAGALISFASAVSLRWPRGPLEPMWRLNPRAHDGFAAMGGWAIALLLIVCAGCAASAVGLWRGRRWGHRLAVVGLGLNLIGDAANALLKDARAAIGIPIAGVVIAYLMSRGVRRFFAGDPQARSAHVDA